MFQSILTRSLRQLSQKSEKKTSSEERKTKQIDDDSILFLADVSLLFFSFCKVEMFFCRIFLTQSNTRFLLFFLFDFNSWKQTFSSFVICRFPSFGNVVSFSTNFRFERRFLPKNIFKMANKTRHSFIQRSIDRSLFFSFKYVYFLLVAALHLVSPTEKNQQICSSVKKYFTILFSRADFLQEDFSSSNLTRREFLQTFGSLSTNGLRKVDKK